jgi:hypothetical protein
MNNQTTTNKENTMSNDTNTPAKMSELSIAADGRGIDRNFNELLDEATGVIGKYIQDGDDDRLHFEHMLETIVANVFAEKGGDVDRWTAQVQAILKARATDRDTIYPCNPVPVKNKPGKTWIRPAGVPLNIGEDDLVADHGRSWGLPCKYIHFANLKPTDSMYTEGFTDAEGITQGRTTCVAIAFDPDQANGVDDYGRPLARTMQWNGQTVTVKSDWDATGYVGIVRTFATYQDMVQARQDLMNALKVIRMDVPTDEEIDTFANNEWVDEADRDINYDSHQSL